MSMDGCICRIERLENGFEVEISDPKIASANDSAKVVRYRSPWKAYAFKTAKEVVAFLEKNLEKAVPNDEYSSCFDEACEED